MMRWIGRHWLLLMIVATLAILAYIGVLTLEAIIYMIVIALVAAAC